MISLILLVPILGSLILMPLEENSLESRSRIKQIALATSCLNLLLSVYIWISFDSNYTQFQFVEEFNQLDFLHFYVGIDGISLYFILMTTFITPICILSNWDDIQYKIKYYLISFLLLETLQIAVFVVLDLLLFYIFFESVLIPLFLIVGIWGASENRIRASFLLFLYTLFGSLWMLLAIMVLFHHLGTTDLEFLSVSDVVFKNQHLLWIAFFISFAIKTPLWPTHGWLFRAHAEAPLAGSIILAAVILKLATYGYLRIILPLLPDSSSFFIPLVQTVAIITLIYSSLATLRQIDLKALIAYSSVGHMAIAVLGIFSNTIQGIEGALMLSIAHAFVSPALFICVGGILYSRYHTRIIKYYRGIALRMPVFAIFFFLFTLFNMAIPLSANWIGELLSLSGTFQRSPLVGVLGSLSIVLSAAYSIWLYNRISFGSFSPYLKPTKDLTRREFFLLLPLVLLTVLFGMFPNIVLDNLHLSVSTLLYRV